ncbi:hypothetical protein BDV97DRAFT_341 [Delphinella strobiligena]|nr:hypothetical protein BDV97DRAFT_341 [Delphinella strobiligena]
MFGALHYPPPILLAVGLLAGLVSDLPTRRTVVLLVIHYWSIVLVLLGAVLMVRTTNDLSPTLLYARRCQQSLGCRQWPFPIPFKRTYRLSYYLGLY